MRTHIRCFAAAAAALLSLAASAEAQLATKETLTLEGAKMVAAAAAAEARKGNAGGAVAIVDDGGNLVYLERLPGTFAAAANISIAKARSAAQFERDTRVFEDAIKSGRFSLVANPELLPLQGGVPIVVRGRVVGAVGVSGANSAQQDEEIAKAAARVLESSTLTNEPSRQTAYAPAEQVMAAFAAGKPLIETSGYKVHASRREGPGMAELHARDTDIIYVLEGTTTLVTGGEIVDAKSSAPDEVRGAALRGGKPQTLRRGDVFIVPQGVPHWFQQVEGPLLYYVVKATGDIGGTEP